MEISKVAVGRTDEATAPDAIKAGFAEFIATFLFVFIGVGSVVSYSEQNIPAGGLVGIAIAHGLAIVITVAATANISGGHVNPAVAFGLVVRGQITILRVLVYWVGQLLAAALASALLKFVIVSAEVCEFRRVLRQRARAPTHRS
ncbi:hypothetical protein Mapa_008648 [Marchantia paleacea]|nr:hypothetical protein Mapa_008648 [Marchantia paleacea]